MAKKSRKVFATTATAALVASAVAPIASSAAGFSDVTKPEYKEAINALADAGILNGYENGTFKPENKVTRGEVAKVITLIRHLEEGTKTPFKDVKDGYWSTQYINSLYAAKLVNGYEDGTFKPEGNVTRAEFAKLVVDAYGLTLTNSATPFTDVKAGNWATPYIQTAYANGLIKGVTASKFDPSAPIKRGDLAILLHRADSKFGDVIGNNFPGVELVKATNATTVEVTFKEEVKEDVKASDFAIEGLTVSNAALKQGTKNTVVLTTSTQEGGKQYTVKSGAATLGKFIGVSAVIPSKISMQTTGVQGVVGKEVTVKAEVTVAEGQSKAGIPVTFNVDGDNNALNKDIVQEVYTDDKGVATFTYTQYNAATTDEVIVYPTGNASARSFGKVYWGADVQLAVKSVKDPVNGKVVTSNESTVAYEATVRTAKTGALQNGGYVYVNIAENLDSDVTNNQTVTVVDNNTGLETKLDPTVNNVPVKVSSNGVASYSIKGSNQEVNPVVWLEKTQTYVTGTEAAIANNAQDITVAAPSAVFQPAQTGYTFSFDRTAQFEAPINEKVAYKVTVKTADGKPYVNSSVNVRLKEAFDNNINTNTQAFLYNADGTKAATNGVITVKTNSNGEAVFYVESAKDTDFTVPQVWIDVEGGKNGNLDVNEPTADAPRVVFTTSQFSGFTYDSSNDGLYSKGVYAIGKKLPTLTVGTVNQNNNAINKLDVVTYVIKNTGGEATVNIGGDSKTLAHNETYTVVKKYNGQSEGTVTVSSNTATTLSIVATGKTTDGTSKELGEKVLQFVNASEPTGKVDGTIVGYSTQDSAADSYDFGYLVVSTSAGYKYVEYNADSKYQVGATSTDVSAFETALSLNDVITIEDNTFKLTNSDKSSTPSQVEGNKGTPTAPPTYNTGEVKFTATEYDGTADATIELTDLDLNLSSTAFDTASVEVSDSKGLKLTVELTEDAKDSGKFVGTIAKEDIVKFTDGELVATYKDAANAKGEAETVTAKATKVTP